MGPSMVAEREGWPVPACTIACVHARFYAPGARDPGETVELPEEEAEHLTRVLRLKAGDPVRVFNGRGSEFEARVERSGRRKVCVTLECRAAAGIEPRIPVTVLQAALKTDSMDAVVRDAVMMGAAAIQPVLAARSETTLAALTRGRRQDRWMRIAIAAAKQCGRATVPPVHEPLILDAALAQLGGPFPLPAMMFVEPGLPEAATPLHAIAPDPPPHATILLGPEGGWAPDEIRAAATRARLVTLRLPTIRANAMPAVAMAALYASWGAI
jgi:16S rRNA (uracil1498-N3)-methyltransferase